MFVGLWVHVFPVWMHSLCVHVHGSFIVCACAWVIHIVCVCTLSIWLACLCIQLTILDIHNLTELFFFSDNILVRLKSCISLLKARLSCLPDADNVSIAFPDEGLTLMCSQLQ